jgi:hypothetical protein
MFFCPDKTKSLTEAQRGKAASFQRSAFSGQLLESRSMIDQLAKAV